MNDKSALPVFDVMREPWIPVRPLDSGNGDEGAIRLVGVRDALINADQYAEISHESPMVEYGLYRLLIAFLMDIFRPKYPDDLWRIQDENVSLDADVDAYVSRCEQHGASFNLFDAEHPFLQTPYRDEWDKANQKSASLLDFSLPSGNNHVHFVHAGDGIGDFSYADAAVRLPAIQLFCTAGVRGYPSGVNGAPPYYALIRGETLRETLIRSTPAATGFHNISYADVPVWWMNSDEIEPKRVVNSTSALFGMLFPARRVTLIPEDGRIREVYFGPGLNFDKSVGTWTDPHVGYSFSDKGRSAWTPQTERAVWRNIGQLVRQGNRPAVIDSYLNDCAQSGDIINVILYGVETDQASYINGMRHDVQLPADLNDNPEAVETAQEMVKDADAAAWGLKQSLRVKEVPESSRNLCAQQFYDACESDFWGFLGRIARMSGEPLQAARLEWLTLVRDHALRARRSLLSTLGLRSRAYIQLVKAESVFLGFMRKRAELLKEAGN